MSKWEKIKKYSVIMFTVVLILYVLYVIIATINNFPAGKILDDEPLYSFACKIHPLTRVVHPVSYSCEPDVSRWLKEWEGYHGCDNSTKGYNNQGRIEGLTKCGVVRLT